MIGDFEEARGLVPLLPLAADEKDIFDKELQFTSETARKLLNVVSQFPKDRVLSESEQERFSLKLMPVVDDILMEANKVLDHPAYDRLQRRKRELGIKKLPTKGGR